MKVSPASPMSHYLKVILLAALSAGILFAEDVAKPGEETRGSLRAANVFSDRCVLQRSMQPIDLGSTPPNTPADSDRLTISDGQKATLPQNLNAEEDPVLVPTVLHGLADLLSNGGASVQAVLSPGESLGAVLLGDGFALLGKQVSSDGKSLKFVGDDGKPGIDGGSSAEQETVSVKFLGAKAPGAYSAKLRIVTQAANLYYIDIPIHVSVKQPAFL